MKDFKTFAELINFAAEKYGDKTALQIRRSIKLEKISFAQIPALVTGICDFFDKENIKSGNHILIVGTNSPEYVLLILACFVSGVIAVPVDYRTSGETIKKIAEQTKAKAAFYSPVAQIFESLAAVKHKYVLETLLEQVDRSILIQKIAPREEQNEVCELLYTSGTTGEPKGVEFNEEKMVQMAVAAQSAIPSLPQYRTVSVLPLSHVLEQIIGTALFLLNGVETTFLPVINSSKLRQAVIKHKPTHLVLVPQVINVLWRRILERADAENSTEKLNSALEKSHLMPRFIRKKVFSKIYASFGGDISFIVSAGAPLNTVIAENFVKIGIEVLDLYGTSETLATHVGYMSKDSGTVGRPLPGIESKLDADGQILIKSPFMSTGYFENKAKTKQVFVDGWYHTGDIGEIEGNKLKIIGRGDFKLVTKSGDKIYCEDIEKKLDQHPGVVSSCIIGLDDEGSDKIHAVLIVKNGYEPEQIVREVNQILEAKQQILDFSLWPQADFPRTHTLKLNRKEIKQFATSKNKSLPVSNTEQFANTVDEIITQCSPAKAKVFDAAILSQDLKYDSIARAELCAVLEEKLDAQIDPLSINEKTTVAEIKALINQKGKTREIYLPTWQFSPFVSKLRQVLVPLIWTRLHNIWVKPRVECDWDFDPEGKLLTFNHPGFLDFITIQQVLGNRVHNFVGLATIDLWGSKPLGKMLEFGGTLPIDPSGKDLVPLLQLMSDLLDSDKRRFFGIAPQGRIQRNVVEDKFKEGAAYIAKVLNLPVIVTRMIGYEDILPPPGTDVSKLSKVETIKSMMPKKKGEVIVRISKPLTIGQDESVTAFTARLQEVYDSLK